MRLSLVISDNWRLVLHRRQDGQATARTATMQLDFVRHRHKIPPSRQVIHTLTSTVFARIPAHAKTSFRG